MVRSDNQPAYRLVPVHGRRFRIAELRGYSVEFCGDATIDEVIFHQPNGTFVAARRITLASNSIDVFDATILRL